MMNRSLAKQPFSKRDLYFLQHGVSLYSSIIVFSMHHFKFDEHQVIHCLVPDVISYVYHFIQFFGICYDEGLAGDLQVKRFSFFEEVQLSGKCSVKFVKVLLRAVHKEPNLPRLIHLHRLHNARAQF